MSSYNGEKYIGQQIESLLGQDNQYLEILIRDDGSKDKTVAIIEEFSTKFSNLRLLKDKNKGVISSF
jgi:glycosyltransferase involved in cell wall biosynthesis